MFANQLPISHVASRTWLTHGPTCVLARFLSTGNPLLSCESPKLETFSDDRVSLQLLRDWKEDRERWERECSRLHAKDRSQSILIAELKAEALDLRAKLEKYATDEEEMDS